MRMYVNDFHTKEFRYCHRGIRRFFKERSMISWGEFLREGIDADVLGATGDAMALRAIEYKRKNKGGDNGR
jgi:hypothetical protein